MLFIHLPPLRSGPIAGQCIAQKSDGQEHEQGSGSQALPQEPSQAQGAVVHFEGCPLQMRDCRCEVTPSQQSDYDTKTALTPPLLCGGQSAQNSPQKLPAHMDDTSLVQDSNELMPSALTPPSAFGCLANHSSDQPPCCDSPLWLSNCDKALRVLSYVIFR
jgi:hypothetical protein